MKKLLLGCLAVVLVLSSCSSDNGAEGVLSESAMVSILLDIYEAESSLADLRLNRDTTMAIFDTYEQLIFDRYGVGQEDYKKSLSYYFDNPELLEGIYEIMIDSLTLQESKIKAIEESERAKRDSLAKVEANKDLSSDSTKRDSTVLEPLKLNK